MELNIVQLQALKFIFQDVIPSEQGKIHKFVREFENNFKFQTYSN